MATESHRLFLISSSSLFKWVEKQRNWRVKVERVSSRVIVIAYKCYYVLNGKSCFRFRLPFFPSPGTRILVVIHEDGDCSRWRVECISSSDSGSFESFWTTEKHLSFLLPARREKHSCDQLAIWQLKPSGLVQLSLSNHVKLFSLPQLSSHGKWCSLWIELEYRNERV